MPSETVRLFGRPEIRGNGRRTHLAANQLHRFLAYLAVRADWVSRDEAVFLFWPDRVDAVGRRNLRKLLHRAHHDVTGIETEGDRIRWQPMSDLTSWRAAVEHADASAAITLHRGALLDGLDPGASTEYLAWIEGEREQLLVTLIDVVVARCERIAGTSPRVAAELSTNLLKIAPLDGRAVSCALRSLAAADRRDELERVYDAHLRALASELGGTPDAATRSLYEELQRSVAETDSDRRPEAISSGRLSPVVWGSTSFLGRRAERAQLHEQLASAFEGDGGVAAVEGEAGVGKTRLIETFLADLPDGIVVFTGRCYERDLSAPLEPIRAALGVRGIEDVLDTPDAVRFAASEGRDRGSVHRALTSRLVEKARQADGAVLFVDDLQWSDAATLEFLAYAAHRIRNERVLIVVSYRREDRTVLERWKTQLSEHRAIRTVRLGRFDGELTHSLVAEILGGDGAEVERFADFVHGESEGNPFYVLEYLRWLRDARLLKLDGTRVVEAPSRERLAEASVPESIRSLIWARYRAFGEEARSVLDAAAVIGRTFELSLLERVVEGSPLALWSTFEPLIEAGLIVAGSDGSYAFSHDKLRQTVYESLGPPARRMLHGRVVEALASEGSEDAELAHHCLRAARWSEAYEHLKDAARIAERDSAWEVARAAHARILAIAHRLEEPDVKRFEALQAIERLLEYMDRRPEWVDTIERLTVLAERIGDPCGMAEALLKRMAMFSVQGDRRAAAQAFERADELWTQLDDAGSRARGYREVAYLAWMRGDYGEVIDASFAAMDIDRALGQQRALAATAENISHAYRWLDDDDEATRWAEQASTIYEKLGDPLATYVRLDIQAWMHLREGDDAAAAEVIERLIPICVQLEDKHLVVEKYMTLGKIHLSEGRYDDALDSFSSAAVQGAATGDLRHEGYPRISAGVAREGLGAYRDAARSYLAGARLLEASFAMTGIAADELGQGDALVLHAGVARRHLDGAVDARDSLVVAERIFERSGDANRLGLAQMKLGALDWSTGDLEQAITSYRHALETAIRAGMPEREIAARASLGVAYRDLGRLEESIAAGREAVDRVRAMEDPLGEAFLLSSLASSYQLAGRIDEARGCLTRSLDLRRSCGDASGAAATLRTLTGLGGASTGRTGDIVA